MVMPARLGDSSATRPEKAVRGCGVCSTEADAIHSLPIPPAAATRTLPSWSIANSRRSTTLLA
jgi:hypothetical protein